MTFSAIIIAAAHKLSVPGVLLLAICTSESNLQNVISPHDHGSPSYGLCQVKVDTAKSLGFEGLPDDLMVPEINAYYAAKYLKMQLDRYENDWCKATSAYNAGVYNPSSKVPGKPRNLQYVNGVILHLDEEHKDSLICGPREVEQP